MLCFEVTSINSKDVSIHVLSPLSLEKSTARFDSVSMFCFDLYFVFEYIFFYVKVITGVSDAELNKFDVIEGNEYERITVEVVRMVSVWELGQDLCKFWCVSLF